MEVSQSRSRASLIELIMFATYAFFAVNWIAGSTLTPQIMKYFGLTSFVSATLISNAITIAKIIGNFLAAGLLVKLLPKKAIGLGSLLIVLGCALAILSPAYALFILGRFIMGFGGALYVVYFSPMVVHYFTPKQRPTVNALNGVAYNFGSIVAMLIVGPVIQWLVSWQASMTFFAIISAILFVAWLLLGEDFPLANKQEQSTYSIQAALKEKVNWALPFTYSGILTFYLVMLNIFPMSGTQVIDGKTLSTLTAVGGIIGSLLAIALSKRYNKRLPVIRFSGIGMTAFGALMFYTNQASLASASALLIGIFMFLPISSLMMIPQELPGANASRITTIMGLFWALSYIIETLLYFLIGFVIDASGVQAGLLLGLGVSITCFIGSFLLPETNR